MSDREQLRELLAARAVGALSPDETRAVDLAAAADPALADELAALIEASAGLSDVLDDPGAPPPAIRARLLESVAAVPAGAAVYERFAARFAAIFDVSVARARELFAHAADPASWEPGPGPGSWLIHFAAGPACAGADTGFVKCAPGARFPWHRHLGAEQNLVLAGEAEDSSNGRLRPGDEPADEPGTEHDFRVVSDEPFVYAVRVFGVDFDVKRPGS
jgi:anti-sigma factor ChrR (cupin superfamily)